MSTRQRPNYPPLTGPQKRVFAFATVAAFAFSIALALTRLAVIRWWLLECDPPTATCRAAEFGFTWWWVLLISGILAIAWVAHRLTAERLITS